MSWNLYPVSELHRLKDQWQTLNLNGVGSPLLDIDFVLPLLKEFASGNEILACHEQAGQTGAMAVLTPKGRGVWETFQPSQAPIGLWIQRTDLAWEPLLSPLIRTLPGFPLMLGITQQDPQLLPRPRDGGAIKTLDYIQTAKILLQGSFDVYWNARGKNLRLNMRKQRSKLEKEGVTLRLQSTTDPAEVGKALVDYGRLESSGWKEQRGTAVHLENAQGRFYKSMLEAFCARGVGRIYRYWYNDRVAAMNLCIQSQDAIIVLKTTYDESIKDGTSPAFLLRQDQIKELLDEGKLRSLEFYGKLMEWHQKWTGEVRTVYHINNYRFPFLSRIHDAMKKPALMLDESE